MLFNLSFDVMYFCKARDDINIDEDAYEARKNKQ
jgi:hypothetical protein